MCEIGALVHLPAGCVLTASRATSHSIVKFFGGNASQADVTYVAQQHVAVQYTPFLDLEQLDPLAEAVTSYAEECPEEWSSQKNQKRFVSDM